MSNIGYFYNLHVNLDSFLYCIATVKKYSPESPIHLVTDKSLHLYKKYISLANVIGLPITLRDESCTYIDRADPLDINLPKMQEFFARMYMVCNMLDTKWIVRLEDDVHMRGPIKSFPSTECAGNHESYGMGGGSIFNREVFIKLYEDRGKEYIENKCKADNNKAWAGDGLVREFFTERGYTYSRWEEITEDWDEAHKEAAFHHGDKSLYDKAYLKQRGL